MFKGFSSNWLQIRIQRIFLHILAWVKIEYVKKNKLNSNLKSVWLETFKND